MAVQPVNARQGKITITVGVAAIGSSFAVQAANVQSFASQSPPQFGSNTGSMTLLTAIAGLLFFSGVILTIVGIVRYAQSGSDGAAVPAPASAQRMAGITPEAGPARVSVSASAPAFCSSCGARIAGEGRYCASCGRPTAH